jgi:N-acetylneuraminic acid mutarotase
MMAEEANEVDLRLSGARNAVLMSRDILPLVLDFLPRTKMRNVALVCQFYKRVVAAHLDPLIFTLKERNFPRFPSSYTPLLFSLKTQEWCPAAAPDEDFQVSVEWTKLNGFFYIFSRPNFYRYDPLDDVWLELRPPRRSGFRQECGFTSLENKLYLVGGKNAGMVPADNVEVYDTVLESWDLSVPPAVRRAACSTTTLNGYIYLVGGFDGSGSDANAVAQVERWSPDNHTWEFVASLNQAKWSCQVCTVNNRLYVFGGVSSGIHLTPFVPVQSCEMYCPLRDEWTIISAMPTPRTSFSICVVGHCVYVMGGVIHSGSESYFSGQETSLVEIYDTRANTWSAGVPMPEEEEE